MSNHKMVWCSVISDCLVHAFGSKRRHRWLCSIDSREEETNSLHEEIYLWN